MFLGDFHIHSTFSDGKLSIPELVDLYGQRNFGAIAITDHICDNGGVWGRAAHALQKTLTTATFPLYLEVLRSEAKRAWKKYRMVVLPGFEITQNHSFARRSAHILGVGYTQYIDPKTEIITAARKIRATGGLAIAAHPVPTRVLEAQTYYLWQNRHELAQEFDAWEVASGRVLFPEVQASGLPMIASSDLHSRKQITSWKTLLHCERHPEAILEAIRSQRIGFRFYEDLQHDTWSSHARLPRPESLGLGPVPLACRYMVRP